MLTDSTSITELAEQIRQGAAAGAAAPGTPEAGLRQVAQLQNAAEHGFQENVERILNNHPFFTLGLAAFRAIPDLVTAVRTTTAVAAATPVAGGLSAGAATAAGAGATGVGASLAAGGSRFARLRGAFGGLRAGAMAAGSRVGAGLSTGLRAALGIAPNPLSVALAGAQMAYHYDSNNTLGENSPRLLADAASAFGLPGMAYSYMGHRAIDEVEQMGVEREDRRSTALQVGRLQAERNVPRGWLNRPDIAAKLATPAGRQAWNHYIAAAGAIPVSAIQRTIERIDANSPSRIGVLGTLSNPARSSGNPLPSVSALPPSPSNIPRTTSTSGTPLNSATPNGVVRGTGTAN
jgi:hypothetical protein